MKSKKILIAGAFALACASLASAQTTIRITGSTAFRAATISSIKNLLNAGYDQAYTGTSSSGFQYGTFVGTGNATSGVSGQSLVIQCAWTGSVEGIRDVSQGLNQPFIKASVANTTGGTDTITGVSATTSNTAIYENAIPDITLADNVQAITVYPNPAMTEQRVGVIPFVFVKGRLTGAHPAKTAYDTSLTNITNQLAQTLLSGGLNLSLLTGSSADAGTKIYAMGRNPLSGTRTVNFAETGFGSNSSALQFKPTVTGTVSTGTITAVAPFPEDTVNGFVDGDNGYSSGGTLADELGRIVVDVDGSGNSLDGVPFGLVGYMGVSDAARLLGNINGTSTTDVSYVLSYNGVSLPATYTITPDPDGAGPLVATAATSWDFSAIKEGKYSLWSYVYLGYRNAAGPNSTTALSGAAKTFADNLVSNIQTTLPSSAGIKLSDMNVQRSSEGAPITSL